MTKRYRIVSEGKGAAVYFAGAGNGEAVWTRQPKNAWTFSYLEGALVRARSIRRKWRVRARVEAV